MEETRKTLTAQLKDTVAFFKDRKTVGRMKTEHSIFIPSKLMLEKEGETAEFIHVARHIGRQSEWRCPVAAEQVNIVKTQGVEFVFSFQTDTDYVAIMDYISGKI
ncbi:hypothetical protein HOBO_46 [Bacillus phage Hobo]|uniref:Uncharacterized protein n=2 Tax=Caeruleovirus BM15 TaxID=1985178 RepID=A0A0S2MUE0_9CAUD|nr:hypothetical protein FD732_gp046 [Bacillus phage BM15]ALO79467.1 hypothetical protein BM10_46 [Bacillus phage BM15]AXQ66827.1 hypothetical protein HOBO_46 [Bacillus phage Hobo]AXQ67723.1 hypothetical protein KIOSHI_46 [Bacillus phage Kioshi]